MATTRKFITGMTAALILSVFAAPTVHADSLNGSSFFSSFDGFLDDLYRNIGPFYRNIGPF